jgi:hypothetical protein
MLTYTQYQTQIANLMVVPTSDPNFGTMLPSAIDQAEQYLYRELDLLNTVQTDTSAALTAGSRNFLLPNSIGTFIVTQQINVCAPSTLPDNSVRTALTPTSQEMLNMLWPSVSGSTVPQYFAMLNQGAIIVGPWPDQAYTVEVVGTIRPAPLSASNVTTLLSVYFPDLMISASMMFATAYQRDFGAAGNDDPKQAVNWAGNTQMLLTSAKTEETRKRLSEHALKEIAAPSPETRA